MANKTVATDASVEAYLDGVEPAGRAADARRLIELMARATGEPPTMWGPSMIGFGCYRYALANGRAEENFRVGFAPRKANMVLYVLGDDEDGEEAALLARLGRHKRGKSCLYIGALDGVDLGAVEQLVRRRLDRIDRRAPLPA